LHSIFAVLMIFRKEIHGPQPSGHKNRRRPLA
jgi:hypothetical protein